LLPAGNPGKLGEKEERLTSRRENPPVCVRRTPPPEASESRCGLARRGSCYSSVKMAAGAARMALIFLVSRVLSIQ
jgi:hypothetical protein